MKTETGIATLAVAATLIASTVAQANVHAKNIKKMAMGRVSTAYHAVKNMQEQLQEYYHANSSLPGTDKMNQNVTGLKYVAKARNLHDGTMVVIFGAGDPVLNGRRIILTPAKRNGIKDYTKVTCATSVDLANYGLTAAVNGDKVLSGSLFDEFDCIYDKSLPKDPIE